MPRNANGVYTLPATPPTTIDADWFNLVLDDIAAALTASFSVDGSIAPADLVDAPEAFQAKIGLSSVIAQGLARISALESRNSAEIGSIVPTSASSRPHHLLCDGSLVSRTTYAKLFAKIGTTFGAGDGSTTFALPDLRNRSVRGWDNGRGVDAGRALGSFQAGTVLSHAHTAAAAATGAHVHTAVTASSGAHTHAIGTYDAGSHYHYSAGSTGTVSADHYHSLSGTSDTTGDHAHGLLWDTRGHNSSQNYVLANIPYSNFIGGTTGAGEHTHTASGVTSGVSALHNHSFSGATAANGSHAHSLTIDAGGQHSHTASASSAGAHTHNVTVDSTGGQARVRSVATNWLIKFE